MRASQAASQLAQSDGECQLAAPGKSQQGASLVRPHCRRRRAWLMRELALPRPPARPQAPAACGPTRSAPPPSRLSTSRAPSRRCTGAGAGHAACRGQQPRARLQPEPRPQRARPAGLPGMAAMRPGGFANPLVSLSAGSAGGSGSAKATCSTCCWAWPSCWTTGGWLALLGLPCRAAGPSRPLRATGRGGCGDCKPLAAGLPGVQSCQGEPA